MIRLATLEMGCKIGASEADRQKIIDAIKEKIQNGENINPESLAVALGVDADDVSEIVEEEGEKLKEDGKDVDFASFVDKFVDMVNNLLSANPPKIKKASDGSIENLDALAEVYLRIGKTFTEEGWKRYVKDHPKADKKKHKVVTQEEFQKSQGGGKKEKKVKEKKKVKDTEDKGKQPPSLPEEKKEEPSKETEEKKEEALPVPSPDAPDWLDSENPLDPKNESQMKERGFSKKKAELSDDLELVDVKTGKTYTFSELPDNVKESLMSLNDGGGLWHEPSRSGGSSKRDKEIKDKNLPKSTGKKLTEKDLEKKEDEEEVETEGEKKEKGDPKTTLEKLERMEGERAEEIKDYWKELKNDKTLKKEVGKNDTFSHADVLDYLVKRERGEENPTSRIPDTVKDYLTEKVDDSERNIIEKITNKITKKKKQTKKKEDKAKKDVDTNIKNELDNISKELKKVDDGDYSDIGKKIKEMEKKVKDEVKKLNKDSQNINKDTLSIYTDLTSEQQGELDKLTKMNDAGKLDEFDKGMKKFNKKHNFYSSVIGSKIANDLFVDALSDRITRDFLSSRGVQRNRKDKDLMVDTGGNSKGMDSEPHGKPPREENKRRWRKKRKSPSDHDQDTDNDPDNRKD